MSAPRLGVLTGVAGADAIAPLLCALSDRCDVTAWEPGLRVDAVLAVSWRAPLLREATREAANRLVLWDDPADPAPAEIRERSTVTVFGPDPCVDARAHRAVPPFLRARWRARFMTGWCRATTTPVSRHLPVLWRMSCKK